ncbi:MAG: DUF2605 family protein [Cyanobium sp.]|jgi:hypothetical protein
MSAVPSPDHPESGADLLNHLLGSLLDDFRIWFDRGDTLLDCCPDVVMSAEERQQLREAIAAASRELASASALCNATTAPVALGLETLAPWHQLVMRLWGLSARLRALQVPLPQLHWPEPPAFPG